MALKLFEIQEHLRLVFFIKLINLKKMDQLVKLLFRWKSEN